MRRALSVLTAAALAVVVFATPAQAKNDVPDEFGSDWDNPTSAAKPIEHPDTPSCEVSIVDHEFDNFDPFESTYQPPRKCDTEWSKVVLRMDGAVSGRQYDRMGELEVGGVPIFKTSTPEPSQEGIEWSVEKDVSGYAKLLRDRQPVSMRLGNVVDETYTGVLDVRVTLTFYEADTKHPAVDAAEQVLGLSNVDDSGADLTGDLEVPRNTERLLADVYATGSGGDCEEFWYLAAPADTDYSCAAGDGPYREVQVLIDGVVAGIAAPYPHIYTGGWSNPYLWYTLQAPRALDIRPITYDLTPYLGALNDGGTHTVSIRVAGMPKGASGWSTPTAFRAWQDEGSSVVRGGLLAADTTDLANEVTYTPGGDENLSEVHMTAGHRHTATGWLATSHGDITTTVDRVVSASGSHYWGAGENPDGLKASWNDTETVTVLDGGAGIDVRETSRDYRIDGDISVDADDRLTTTLKLADEAAVERSSGVGDTLRYGMENTYTGQASWTLDVPREDRHAVGFSQERYRLSGDRPCYDHTLSSRNGVITKDRYHCGSVSR